jgi:hypothetical protein
MTEAEFERLYAEVLGRHVEPAALQADLEDPTFVAWLLQRLLADKPDLRLLARHILEQLGAEAEEAL